MKFKAPMSAEKLGRPLTSTEKLANLRWHLTHCPKCEHYVPLAQPVCEQCGEELTEYGKN